MSNVNVSSFVNSIDSTDLSYKKFSNTRKYKEIYVEGYEDELFYRKFLAKMYDCSTLNTDFVVCHNKDEVLLSSKKYAGTKKKFIVDLDYLPFDREKYNSLAITTGYSMENFIFYKHSNKYNYELIFEKLYKNKFSLMINRLKEYKKELEKFKKKGLYYFAFLKTCMEFTSKYEFIDAHKNIEKINYSENAILKEIDDMYPSRKERFLNRYEENKKIIFNSDCMLMRGHDLFDHLFHFLQIDFPTLTKKDLYNLAKLGVDLEVPANFKMYF